MARKTRSRWRTPDEQARWSFDRHRNANRLAHPGPTELVVVLDRPKPDFNVGKIFRAADAFGVREIHLIGIEWFNPAPAMGAFKHVPAHFSSDLSACCASLADQGYTLVAFDPGRGQELPTAVLPRRCAFLFGHEEFGFSPEVAGMDALQWMRIPQLGHTRSLNLSVAAAIAMYEYVRQFPPTPAAAAAATPTPTGE
ncbi:MAG: TrmH family RNA methyltransferase [Candidatus Eisenbacteria bacterium]|uniref:TrmH family RNA methyltransferase n=1 Tax=Eiseniibacteriota bacterium TaxID=2212470 RepID=A0A956RR64_UNCEI|nr:TrmH family RNA methyltransferase [Candidatus Eisenbacteria bacterium]